MTRLFEMVAKPLATIQTPGAFLGNLRLMAIDGTVFDVPDTPANAKVFGYRSVGEGMLLMWDRGLHSFKMVHAAIQQKCHILGRVPANVKFEVVKTLADGSYLSWIAPDGKSKKKGATFRGRQAK
ncbi:hypothetical protein [Sphaerospermopsis torques-reginae]|uniref:hypothetical protein n=1 Tax=Sphaerospermopsis torques-reginae TaxID=984207 RepID=UPI001FEB8E23|nr:hypothetical protein [Sphaerospermopsis torques-reginae]